MWCVLLPCSSVTTARCDKRPVDHVTTAMIGVSEKMGRGRLVLRTDREHATKFLQKWLRGVMMSKKQRLNTARACSHGPHDVGQHKFEHRVELEMCLGQGNRSDDHLICSEAEQAGENATTPK